MTPEREAELRPGPHAHINPGRLAADLNEALDAVARYRVEVERLRQEIRDHRDSRGHDRCWLNDRALYEALGEPIPDPGMPARDKFLEGCRVYVDSQPTPLPPGGCASCDGAHVIEKNERMVMCRHE